MADISEIRMNVAALKRVDPYAKDILDTASHVALYSFNGDDNEWEKTEIEGALFVYSRNGYPHNSVLIMNRLSTKNLVEPIVKGLDLQLTEPFLLYRNSRWRIYGIWFYDKEECVRVHTLLVKLMSEVLQNNQMTDNKPPVQGPSGPVDIFGMLTKAQEEFKNNAPRAPDVTSQSVMDFFAKAGTGNKEQPFFQKLMSNPAHRVEHIEKQVRAKTPSEDSGVALIEASLAQFPYLPAEAQPPRQSAPALMPPTMFTTAVNRPEPPPEPLTRNQFLHSFSYLLRNDPEFVNKLHEAYVKSFSDMVS